jgi:3-oxoacyl-[acyl-carrier-protein] synthase-3
MRIKITGSGSFVPSRRVLNTEFSRHNFLNEDGTPFKHNTETVIEKFYKITGIEERRYVEDHLQTSDIAFLAAKEALDTSKTDYESIDYIIVAHNFGNVKKGASQSDLIPSVASKVKHLLGIQNPKCIAYDLIFGCPGWVEGMIQANAFIKGGIAKKCLVIGAETLSRVTDPHDRDSMIYADGAGATILESINEEGGIKSHESASFTHGEVGYLFLGESYNKDTSDDTRYIKMYGRKIYEFALNNVPMAMKQCLDESGFKIHDVKKILIHQANEKMDEAIVARFYKLYEEEVPQNIMPMIIHTLGNSSVATVPTLYDLIVRGKLSGHELKKGDIIILASVGAGMNINAIVYQM